MLKCVILTKSQLSLIIRVRRDTMNNLQKAVEGAILQDKYVLGLHWIYDQEKIKPRFNEEAVTFDVLEDSFHKTKKKGDLTHYGDILLHFMNYLNEVEHPDVATYYESFVQWMKAYEGYKDHAMKQVVENVEGGNYKGSDSEELGGLCKISPILLKYQDQPKLAKLYAIAFTKATHDHPLPITLATFFSDVVFDLQEDMTIEEAMEKALQSMPKEIVDLYYKGKDLVDLEPEKAIKELGQACPATQSFPSVIYLLLKYKNDIKAMSHANVRAGGDSAARGMIVGMVCGAAGYIDEALYDGFNAKSEFTTELGKLTK